MILFCLAALARLSFVLQPLFSHILTPLKVANELAAAKIPVILTTNRGAQETFEKRSALPGPPLSRSPAAVLAETGVLFGLAIPGEGKRFFLLKSWGREINCDG